LTPVHPSVNLFSGRQLAASATSFLAA
jgi:hypothetical protein